MKYPLAIPDLSGEEERNVVAALRSSWISSRGEFVERFECDFAEVCQTRHAITVSNGTSALHLALVGLDVGPGDEVIVPALTFVAVANAVRYVGAEPVFVDVDSRSWCLDPRRLTEAITPRTKGIIAVHSYGHPADIDAIREVADTYHLWIMEDAAEAHFATYKGTTVGGLGDVATFSFYGNKILTCGEGGALTTDDDKLAARLRLFRGQGMNGSRHYYFPVVGYNYRLTNVACAILCAQLERKDEILADRRKVFAHYKEGLSGVPEIEFQPVAPWAGPAPWLFSVLVDETRFGVTRDELAARLLEAGVETRPFFLPLPHLPPYRESAERRGTHVPVAEALSWRGINLPTHSGLAEADVMTIAKLIGSLRR